MAGQGPQLSYQPFLKLPLLFLALIIPAKPQEGGHGSQLQQAVPQGRSLWGEGAKWIPLGKASTGRGREGAHQMEAGKYWATGGQPLRYHLVLCCRDEYNLGPEWEGA